MTVMVTGGLGFIGTNFVRRFIENSEERVIVLDKITYASGRTSDVLKEGQVDFAVHDLATSSNTLDILLRIHKPRIIFHFAAESHVDNSINNTEPFLQSNVIGTVRLLDAIKNVDKDIRLIHVSTDEVYGSLSENDAPFTETTPYAPRSPYSASKAASDHFVRAYQQTHKLDAIITNCSNNYGPYQHREKFIPTVIWSLLHQKKIPVYGNGKNVRDWIHVWDHCDALMEVALHGEGGEKYNIGGKTQVSNIELATRICKIMGKKPKDCIEFVNDRKGHDFRYDIDNSRIERELGWTPKVEFTKGLGDTVAWYLNNTGWLQQCRKHSE